MKFKLAEIHRDKIKPFSSPGNKSLAESIEEFGLAQLPKVRPVGGGFYEVVEGRTRIEALIDSGEELIPCIVESLTDKQADMQALAANIHRARNWMQEARTLHKYVKSPDNSEGPTQTQLARQLHCKQPEISATLSLMNLIPELQDAVAEGDMKRNPAMLWAKMPEEWQQRAVGAEDFSLKFAKEVYFGEFKGRKLEQLLEDDEPEAQLPQAIPGLFLSGEQVEKAVGGDLEIDWAGKKLVISIKERRYEI